MEVGDYTLMRKHSNKVVYTASLKFDPIADAAHGYRITPKDVSQSDALYREGRDGESGLEVITGQTAAYRLPKLFDPSISCLETARPKEDKFVLSAPSSVGLEAVSLAAELRRLGILDKYNFDCVDKCADYIEHAKSMQYPHSVLRGDVLRARELEDAFRFAANPLNEDTLWVEPVDEIRKAITVHDAQDIKDFRGEQKYDIVFMIALFQHLRPSEQVAVLENMLLQSKGLICFNLAPPVDVRDYDERTEWLLRSAKQAEEVIKGHGFCLSEPFSETVKPSGLDMEAFVMEWRKDRDKSWGVSESCLELTAIHPDLASDLS